MTSKTAPGLVLVALIVASSLGHGQPLAGVDDMESLRRQNAELRERLEMVERDLEAIKKLLAPPSAPARTATAAPSAPAAESFTPAETEKLKTLAGMKGHPARSSLDLSFYGYVKLDAAYDDSRISTGNFARWVETESVLKNDNHFNMTANQTRLGLDTAGPVTEDFRVGGKMEIDFYGAGTGENKPEPMLRHAYLRIDWPRRKMALIAGQTSDIISPLNPNTVNYSVGWWQGNVGYRRPQLRLIQGFRLAEDVELKLDTGVSRTITGRKAFFKEANDPDTGADAGSPTFAARAGLSFPVASKRLATVGVSGHQGREEIHEPDLSGHASFRTWSLNADLQLPLTASLLLQAEAFIGRNFDSHLGGIGQGINTAVNREIDTVGGWASLTLTPSAPWQFNLGAGMDDPDDADLSGNSDPARDARTKNTLVFGNAIYSLTAQVQLALELGWLRTTYKVNSPGEGWRQQFALIYKF
jgi:hypothetical protein